MSEDDGDRPRRSWAEIDRMRDRPRERRDEGRPRGKAAEARARSATDQYLKKLDRTLFAASSEAPGGEPAQRVLDALGSAGLDDACRAYLNDRGPPRETAICSAFLDARDRELRIAALRSLEAELGAGRIELVGGLLRQVRMLADELDDELAEAAEDVLAKMAP